MCLARKHVEGSTSLSLSLSLVIPSLLGGDPLNKKWMPCLLELPAILLP